VTASWRAIVLATLVVVPAFWFVLAGMVSLRLDDGLDRPALAIAFGLAVIPFAFVVLAVQSAHPQPVVAALQAVAAAVVVGIAVSAPASDGVTGLLAGIGAGGVLALRPEPVGRRPRVVALVVTCAATLVLARVAPAVALVSAPVLPFTVLGLADRLAVEPAPARA
jgi:hypothetical protein